MKCPTCSVEFETKSIGDVEVDECPECKGVWFDDDELRQAKDASGEDINWIDFEIWKHEDQFETEPRKLACPKCTLSLVAIDYGDTKVTINCCPKCKGTWLDKGEFEKIVASLTQELDTKSFGDYIKATLKEGLEIITGPESFLSEWKDFTAVLGLMQRRLFVEHPKMMEAAKTIQENNPL
jgi:Zn-finger nucleic acid-binding protein